MEDQKLTHNSRSNKGGVKASRRYPGCHSKDELSLIYVRYKDHVLFKNCNHSNMKPSVREVVGWLVLETQEAIYVCCDRPVEPFPHEKSSESGLVILKSDVLERK